MFTKMFRNTLFLFASILLIRKISTQAAQPSAIAAGPLTTPIPIVKFENPGVGHNGAYKWSYETGNSIIAEETGYLSNPGDPNLEAQHAEGSYSYTAPDGTIISMTYVAGPEGFVPTGSHIPTPPPIPEAIQKALEYIRSLPPSSEDSQSDEPSSPATSKPTSKVRRHYFR